ncbi:transmembrane protein, putative (macronuclear) [Tetrahymena thermophila SB210]|uniref:Transmembrane protein, putative n=1 Tax=Tetrahymena thermophila (strain SB210) TaxID=312017 RepID=Q22AL9_TETTS|nr:transmembrane protein, putative [Tetrahymena thermophila SB210]EAR82337.2 transmembrane protein, putative [Tetrahymena thermophila SB210]|eukprot:XP_001030000.2 transmembrane protein, putative [Tetrahymena thermophila SB210]
MNWHIFIYITTLFQLAILTQIQNDIQEQITQYDEQEDKSKLTKTNFTNLYNNYSDQIHRAFKNRILQDSSSSILVNPLKKGMYPDPINKDRQQTSYEEADAVFQVPRQSIVKISIDLRHLTNYTTKNSNNLNFVYGDKKGWEIVIYTIDTSQDYTNFQQGNVIALPYIFTRDSTQKIDAHLFTIFASKDMFLMFYLRINLQYFSNLKPLLAQSSSLTIKTPERAIYGQNKAFGFVIMNNQAVNLPPAMPVMKSDNSYPDTIITYSDLTKDKSNSSLIQPLNITEDERVYNYLINNDKFWINLQQITVPFIPFISNCQNYGEYIFLSDVVESEKNCELYTPEETIVVNPFVFLQNPKSDTCEDVEFTCILDDAFFSSTQYPKFYEQSFQTELFKMTADPIDFQQDIYIDNVNFDPLNLISVVLQSSLPSTKLPKEITLEIGYYQVDQYKKRIVKAGVTFGQMINKSNVDQSSPFTYKFILKFISLGHAELAINFAFNLPVYFILSSIIGTFSIIMIFFYYCFYRTSNIVFRRVVEKKKELFITFKSLKRACYDLWEFLQLYKSLYLGIILAFIPNFIMQFFISFLMLGGFWSNPFFNCSDLSTERICETSIFESFGAAQVPQSKRRGRLGLTFIVIGFYAIIRISSLYIPISQKDKIRDAVKNYKSNQSGKKQNKFFEAISILEEKVELFTSESHDGNIWQDKIWTRGLFIYLTILVIIIYIVVIYLSFSTYYGANIWFFTFILKASQLFIGECLKLYIEDELLLSSISCIMGMSTSISGLGAIDFFDYLFNTYVALGISTFEKTSQVIVVDSIVESIGEYGPQVQNYISKVFQIESNENEGQEGEEDELSKNKHDLLNDNQEKEDNQSQETGQKDLGNSSIFLTENCEDSMMSIDFQDFKLDEQDDKKHNLKQQNSIKLLNGHKNLSSPIANNLNDDQNRKLQSQYSDGDNEEDNIYQQQYEKDSLELAFEELLRQKFTKKAQTLMVRQQTKANSEQENKIDLKLTITIKMFTDFCNNTFTLISTPFVVVCLWMFYDANQMFVKWNINKKGIVYYFLFNVLNIPFTMMVDMLFLKTNEQFHDIGVREYFTLKAEKFKSRFLTWKADEEEKDELHSRIEGELRNINMWCYSSQQFFCLFIFVAGGIGVIEGVLTIIVNNYNIFSDSSSFFLIFILWIPICFLYDFLIVNLFLERIWGVKKEDEAESDAGAGAKSVKNIIELNSPNSNLSKLNQLKNSFTKLIQTNKKQKQPLKITVLDQQQQAVIFSQDNLMQQGSDQQLQNEENNIITAMQFQTGRLGHSINNEVERNQIILNQPKQKNTLPQQLQIKQLTLQNTIKSDQHEFYSILKQSNDDDNQFEQMKELKESLEKNRYLRLFFEEQIDQINDYDISIHQFILSFSQQKEEDKDRLYKLFLHNFKRFKLQKDAYDQFKKLKNIDIKKAVYEKEKKAKYQDIKSHFTEIEYKDQKFLTKFLKLNKVWLRKNMKLFFEDLLYGESKKELLRLRESILTNFSNIYGEIKVQGNQQVIQVKEVFQNVVQPSKQEIAQQLDQPFAQILKIWLRRSRIQKIAQQLIGGYFLRADSISCCYCKSNWGLLVQCKNKSVEDLFHDFYKRECKTYKIVLNVLELFENNRIVVNPYISLQQKLLSYNQQNSNSLNQNEYLDYFSSPQRSFREDYDNSENEYQDTPNDFIDYDDQQNHNQSNQNNLQNNTMLFKQRFVDRWQEYFSSHAQLISVCLECNDKAQNQYLSKIIEQRQKKERELKLLRDALLALTDSKSSQNLRAPTLQQPEEQDSLKRDPSIPNFIVNNFNFKKGGENIINQNQVIQEENCEDQSYIEDKLSKFEDQQDMSGEYTFHRKEEIEQYTQQNYDQNEEEDECNNQQQEDQLIQPTRRQSTKLNQSSRTIKSEKRTHPQNQNQDNGSEANEEDIRNINEQIVNRSFRVLSARKSSVAQYDDSYQEEQPSQLNDSKNSEDDSENSSTYQEQDQQPQYESNKESNNNHNDDDEQEEEDDDEEDEDDVHNVEEEEDQDNANQHHHDGQYMSQDLLSKNTNDKQNIFEQNLLASYDKNIVNKNQQNNIPLNNLFLPKDSQGSKNLFQLNEVDELEEENRKSTQKSNLKDQITERSLENLKVEYIYEQDQINGDEQNNQEEK